MNSRALYIIGCIACIVITTMEFIHHGAENYIDFRDATINFFNGISSYTPEYVEAHGRYFIYALFGVWVFTLAWGYQVYDTLHNCQIGRCTPLARKLKMDK